MDDLFRTRRVTGPGVDLTVGHLVDATTVFFTVLEIVQSIRPHYFLFLDAVLYFPPLSL